MNRMTQIEKSFGSMPDQAQAMQEYLSLIQADRMRYLESAKRAKVEQNKVSLSFKLSYLMPLIGCLL